MIFSCSGVKLIFIAIHTVSMIPAPLYSNKWICSGVLTHPRRAASTWHHERPAFFSGTIARVLRVNIAEGNGGKTQPRRRNKGIFGADTEAEFRLMFI